MKQDQTQQALPSCPVCCHGPDPALFDDLVLLLQLQLHDAADWCQQWQDQDHILYLSAELPVLPCKQMQLLTV